MKQEFFNLKINTVGQKLYEFTDQTIQWIKKNIAEQLKKIYPPISKNVSLTLQSL